MPDKTYIFQSVGDYFNVRILSNLWQR